MTVVVLSARRNVEAENTIGLRYGHGKFGIAHLTAIRSKNMSRDPKGPNSSLLSFHLGV